MPAELPRDDRRPTILIVDDDPVQRTPIRHSAVHAGLTAIEAGSGTESLRRIRQSCPDLLILDVVMPDIGSFAVCRDLRGTPETAHMPVLLVTGLDDTDSIERAFEVGATAFLTKPLQPGLLDYDLKYMLRAARMEARIRESMRIAQEASIAKSQFLANMGHELRTPLNATLGFSEFMKGEHLGPIGAPR